MRPAQPRSARASVVSPHAFGLLFLVGAVLAGLLLALPSASAADAVERRDREPPEIGVASFNVLRTLPRHDAAHDLRRVLTDRQISVIGWQEADARHWPGLLRRLSGNAWATAYFRERGGRGVPISWRTDRFRLIASDAVPCIPERHSGRLPCPTPRSRPPGWCSR